MEPHRPGSILLVVHVAQHSGPLHSLLPRLKPLVASGSKLTTLLPGPGAAERMASAVGDVMTGGPEALVIPRRPRQLMEMPLALHRQSNAVRDAVRTTEADLVIISSALMPGAIRGAARSGAGVLVYSGEYLPENGPRKLLTAAVTRYAGKAAGSIITCSHSVGRSYERRRVNVSVIWPPVSRPSEPREEVRQRADALRESLDLPPDRPLACSLGAITAGRGQDTLIEAMGNLRDRGINATLVIAGEPYDRPQDLDFRAKLESQVRSLNLQDRVTFLGRISDTPALFGAADVFVNPARFPEPFGRASPEAILSGCPVVSTRVGGTAEALRDGETALMVPPDSPAEMSVAIDHLICDRELADRLVSEGQRDVASRFSPGTGESTFMSAVDQAFSRAESHSSSHAP